MLKIKDYQDAYYDLFMTLMEVGQFTKTIEISKLIEKIQDDEIEIQQNIKTEVSEIEKKIKRLLELYNNNLNLMSREQFGNYQFLLGKLSKLKDS